MTYLPDEFYANITENIPIICVDIIPVRQKDSSWQIGAITRATGSQSGKLALIGGRIWHNETITQAITRHLEADMTITLFSFLESNSVDRPFYVQQYLHRDSSKPPLGFDPSKHAIALTYLVELAEEPQPRNEASDFSWITNDNIPATGYNQATIMQVAFNFLEQMTI